MRTLNRAARMWQAAVLLAMFVLAASGCSEAAESSAQPVHEGEPERGGVVIWGMDQQPPVINTKLIQGSMAAASIMVDPLMDELTGVDPEGNWYPVLIEEIPTTDNGGVKVLDKGMEISFSFKEEATWNDGHPVGCDDFKFTWETTMDDRWMIRSREGWEFITAVECPTEKDTVIKLNEHYAPYLSTFFAIWILPQHELAGKDFNKYWNAKMTVTNGPFQFKRWQRNVRLELERNPNYWNKGENDQPYLDGFTFVFLKDTNTLKVQLRTGEIDVIAPPPDSSLQDELKTYPRATFQASAGFGWEQIALNARNKPLDNINVRRAILFAIDRRQITDVVMRKQVTPLQSTQNPAIERYFYPGWEQYQPDPKKVEEEMTAAGYTREGQWWTKDGKRISLVFKTTAGNVLRMKVAQILQQQLKAQGFDMTISMEKPEIFFGQSTKQGTYDIGLWGWGGGVDPSQKLLFSCEQIPSESNEQQGNNYYGYCNEEADALMEKADITLDDDERARLTRDIQKIMGNDAPLLPLYQRPEVLAYTHRLYGAQQNPVGGDFWRIQEWYTHEGES